MIEIYASLPKFVFNKALKAPHSLCRVGFFFPCKAHAYFQRRFGWQCCKCAILLRKLSEKKARRNAAFYDASDSR